MTKLITKYDATDAVWYAYDNPVESESTRIGEGQSPEDACADYWYQVHGDVAELFHNEEGDCWSLYHNGWWRDFASKQAAVDYANANEWQIKGRF